MARRTAPLVTVVVPVLNEAARIADCIRAIAAQDVPPATVEVLVVDGGSHDGTAQIAARELAATGFGHSAVLRSDDGSRSGNLNTGLAAARGTFLCRVDARSRIPSHYLRHCCEVLTERTDVAVVGGRQRATATSMDPLHIGIARALNNRWAMGGARYRGAVSGPADTVYLGAFRTEQLRAAGGWRVDLAVNEDFELNRRMARLGLVWFDASLVVDYVPRESLRALVAQYTGFGRSKARYWRSSGDRPQPRQLALLAAPVGACAATAVLVARTSPAWRAALAGAAVTGLLATEVGGSATPRASLRSHAAGVCAMACVSASWLGGVWFELGRQTARRRRWCG